MQHCVQLSCRGIAYYFAILAVTIAVVGLGAPAARGGGGINGFSNGVGWTGNNNGTSGPTFTSNTLTLTNGGTGEARSAFFDTTQSIGLFSAAFTYQAWMPGGESLADGATFTLQTQGINALGSEGNGLGVSGITPSAEIEFNLFNHYTIGTNFETDGTTTNYNPTGAVNIASGDLIQVLLTYNGSVLTETLTDLATKDMFNTNYTTDLATVLGSGTAFVGFTGGTGAGTSVQVVGDFVFQNVIPEPSGLALLGIAGVALGASEINRRRRAA
jgi:hypothetical protein